MINYACIIIGATVGIEESVYEVDEDDGSIEVCARVFHPEQYTLNPVGFSFEILLKIVPSGSASIYANNSTMCMHNYDISVHNYVQRIFIISFTHNNYNYALLCAFYNIIIIQPLCWTTLIQMKL